MYVYLLLYTVCLYWGSAISNDTLSHPCRTKWVKIFFIKWDLSNITSSTLHRSPGNHPCYCKTHFTGTIILLLLYFENVFWIKMTTSAVQPDILTHVVKKSLDVPQRWKKRGRKSDGVGVEEELLDMGKLWNETWAWEIGSFVGGKLVPTSV